ncbi:hypothetical protein E8E14_009336 [Neopestalotiopsis sp. 37M]|nr:hypothetical protein E8E14_009336 [Neopestalotiopsis sp. 37M]
MAEHRTADAALNAPISFDFRYEIDSETGPHFEKSQGLCREKEIDEVGSGLTSESVSVFDGYFSSGDRDVEDDTSTMSSEEGVPTTDASRDGTGMQSQAYGFVPLADEHSQPKPCLQDEIFEALTPTQQESRGFFTKGQLTRILTEERVREELARHFDGEDKIAAYAKTICQDTMTEDENPSQGEQTKTKSYIKILAILVLMQKTKVIGEFLTDPSGVNDSDLPFVKTPQPNNKNLYSLRINRQPDAILNCFHSKWWSQFEISNFDEWQWTTLPVIFDQPLEHGYDMHRVLESRRILPFIGDNRTELEGGFSRVSKVAIHPEHHCFRTKPGKVNDGYFAVKHLHSKNRIAFKREVEILKRFSSDRHTHLISLLATYEQSDRFFLVFDWAEADLQAYWRKKNPTPSFDMDTVLWLARQCKGIAHGITKIHEHPTTRHSPDSSVGDQCVVFGHHGDIKPENVLWFAEPGREDCTTVGTLKLSDFGLAEFSVHQTLSMAERSKWGVSLGYRAPEADIQPKAAIGRSYDIWTLGCLYLEFITWMLGGRQLLDEFVKHRNAPDLAWRHIDTSAFFEFEKDNGEMKAVIKPTVQMFICKLHAHQNCSQFFHDFLDMVEDGLLVVKKNNPQEFDRLSIQQIHQKFVKMVGKCESDHDYALKPIPPKSSRK